MKNVLVACEESQRVCKAFLERGFNAFSCDIQEPSGGRPDRHILGDVVPLLNGDYTFETMDGKKHTIKGQWDLIIAHPPCTYLALSGNRWFKPEYKDRFPNRQQQREKAVKFFMQIVNADCEHIAIENPVCIMSTRYRKPDQYIEPYMFGHQEKKKTGLWLKNLPLLQATNKVEPKIIKCKSGVNEPEWHMKTMYLPTDLRRKERSKTFPGIANAMAEQWGDFING